MARKRRNTVVSAAVRRAGKVERCEIGRAYCRPRTNGGHGAWARIARTRHGCLPLRDDSDESRQPTPTRHPRLTQISTWRCAQLGTFPSASV
jgi:hypothetical protein